MKHTSLFLFSAIALTLFACSPGGTKNNAEGFDGKDSVILSFAFTGCNRVDREQLNDTAATNASSANLAALRRIFGDVTTLPKTPSLMFFLGDVVLGETDTLIMDRQLTAWCQQYKSEYAGDMNKAGIELVAVPGNHEMLYSKKVGIKGHDEWPLKGSDDIWMKHMAGFMPKDRERVTGPDSTVNRMTFSFVRGNVAFIVMNTDTYNPPTTANPYGLEGQIPTAWVLDKIKAYRGNSAIEHIFVLGHKPYYVSGSPQTGHNGLPAGPELWQSFNTNTVTAMLSAHVHDYQRMQPNAQGTYQIISGNAGSLGQGTFFGYTLINIMRSGRVELLARGYDYGTPYYGNYPSSPFNVKDSTILTWTKNANPIMKVSTQMMQRHLK